MGFLTPHDNQYIWVCQLQSHKGDSEVDNLGVKSNGYRTMQNKDEPVEPPDRMTYCIHISTWVDYLLVVFGQLKGNRAQDWEGVKSNPFDGLNEQR